MSCLTFCGVAWCLLCIWFHMSPEVLRPKPQVAARDALVPPDGAGERVVPALVLDPSATRAEEGAVDDGREERSADVHEKGAERERGAQLEASVREVEPGGLEEALLLELRAPTGEIL